MKGRTSHDGASSRRRRNIRRSPVVSLDPGRNTPPEGGPWVRPRRYRLAPRSDPVFLIAPEAAARTARPLVEATAVAGHVKVRLWPPGGAARPTHGRVTTAARPHRGRSAEALGPSLTMNRRHGATSGVPA